MPTKAFAVKLKAGTDDGLEDGQFEALVSVFGNVDSYGDVVMPGAFTDTLKAWEASGNPIPVLWSHNSADPDYHIGHVLQAEERLADGDNPGGLWVKAQIDMEAPKGPQAYRLLKGRRVTQFSFAYEIQDAAWAERDNQEVYELRKLHLFEVGPTLIGANQETRLLGVKTGESCPTCGHTKDSPKARPAPSPDEEPCEVKSDVATPSSADVLLSLCLAEADSDI